MHERGGSGTTAVFNPEKKRGATFRTGFYWIVLDWKKIRSETSLKNPIRNGATIVTVQREKISIGNCEFICSFQDDLKSNIENRDFR